MISEEKAVINSFSYIIPYSSTPEVIPEQPEVSSSDSNKPAEVEAKPSTSENVEAVEAESAKVNHELLVCTAEQVRVVALPSLKTRHKYRFGEKAATSIAGLINRPKSEQSGNTAAPPSNPPAAEETSENKVGFQRANSISISRLLLKFCLVSIGDGGCGTSCNPRG